MNIIDIIELNKNGIDVNEPHEFATRYFNDNGGLPDGNYDESDLSGKWLLIKGKQDKFDVYAYRTIDHSTLVLVKVYIKDNPFINDLFYQINGQDFVDGVEWGKLAEYYNVELKGGIGWNNPHTHRPNPNISNNSYYCKTDEKEKYIHVDGNGNHALVHESDVDCSVQFS